MRQHSKASEPLCILQTRDLGPAMVVQDAKCTNDAITLRVTVHQPFGTTGKLIAMEAYQVCNTVVQVSCYDMTHQII